MRYDTHQLSDWAGKEQGVEEMEREEATREAKVLATRGGRYEMEELDGIGMTYRWCVLELDVECPCGECWTITTSSGICPGCGRNQESMLVRERLNARYRAESEWRKHPWRFLKPLRNAMPY